MNENKPPPKHHIFRGILEMFLEFPDSVGPVWSMRNVAPQLVPIEVMRSYATFVYLTEPKWEQHPVEKRAAAHLLRQAIDELIVWNNRQKKKNNDEGNT